MRGVRNDVPCIASGCDRRAWGKGMCQMHYTRWRRYASFEDSRLNTDERFWQKVQKTDSCWHWTGALSAGGYGTFHDGEKTVSAHRYSYSKMSGPVPPGMQLDHLCRNRHCVNPNHLEPVSPRENTLRGISPAAENAKKDRCPRGHEYTVDDTYLYPRGGRFCRECRRNESRPQRRAIASAMGGE